MRVGLLFVCVVVVVGWSACVASERLHFPGTFIFSEKVSLPNTPITSTISLSQNPSSCGNVSFVVPTYANYYKVENDGTINNMEITTTGCLHPDILSVDIDGGAYMVDMAARNVCVIDPGRYNTTDAKYMGRFVTDEDDTVVAMAVYNRSLYVVYQSNVSEAYHIEESGGGGGGGGDNSSSSDEPITFALVRDFTFSTRYVVHPTAIAADSKGVYIGEYLDETLMRISVFLHNGTFITQFNTTDRVIPNVIAVGDDHVVYVASHSTITGYKTLANGTTVGTPYEISATDVTSVSACNNTLQTHRQGEHQIQQFCKQGAFDVVVTLSGCTSPIVVHFQVQNAEDADAKFAWKLSNGTLVSNSDEVRVDEKEDTVSLTVITGCSRSVELHVPKAVPLALNVLGDVCASNAGSLSLNASGGQPPYTYHAAIKGSDGKITNTSSTTGNFTGLSGGAYTVTIVDSGGCSLTLSETVKVKQADLNSITANTVDVSCHGSRNGRIDLNVNPANWNLTYIWPTSLNIINTTSSAHNLAPGTYSITIIDEADNCTRLLQNITINEPDKLVVKKVDVDGAESGKNNGHVLVILEGGVKPYRCALEGLSFDSADGVCNFENLTEKVYHIKIVDHQNCSYGFNVTVTGRKTYIKGLTGGQVTGIVFGIIIFFIIIFCICGYCIKKGKIAFFRSRYSKVQEQSQEQEQELQSTMMVKSTKSVKSGKASKSVRYSIDDEEDMVKRK